MTALPSSRPHRQRGIGLAALAAAAAACAVLASSASSATASSAEASNTIRVQVEPGGQDLAGMQAFIKGFTALHPGVHIKIETITNAAKGGSNLTVVNGSNPPDIAVVPTNAPAYEKLVAQGGLTDLAPVWKAAKLDKRLPASLNALTTYKGKHYAMSLFSVFYSMLYYNVDMFNKDGIAVPSDHRIKSAQQLYDITAALKAHGSQPLAIGANSDFAVSWMVDALLPTSVSKAQVNNYLSSYKKSTPETWKFTDPGFLRVLQQFDDYNKQGVYQGGFLGATMDQAQALFQAGQAGMVLDGSWYAPVLRTAKLPFNFNWLLLPPIDPARPTQLTSYNAIQWTIPAHAKNKALAMKFLAYTVSDEAQANTVIKVYQAFPVVNTVPASAFSTLDPLVLDMSNDAKKHGIQPGWTSMVPGSVGQALANPLIEKMYAGQENPQTAAAKIEAEIQKARKG
jgi:raffinose/stachyose/melibiose transport system substrate-binding protein